MIEPTDWAWLAGFLEGEGSFQIAMHKKKYFTAVLSATNTDQLPLDKCRVIAGGSICRAGGKMWPVEHKHPSRWSIKGSDLDVSLPNILPHLSSKREQAQILLLLRSEIHHGASAGHFGRTNFVWETLFRRLMFKRAINALNWRGTLDTPHHLLAALNC